MLREYSKDSKISIDMAVVKKMYELLGTNMTAIIESSPDWRTQDDAWQKWKHMYTDNLEKGTKHLVWLEGEKVRGFISYTPGENKGEAYLNEFQIESSFQGDGVTFKKLMSMFLDDVRRNGYQTIRTYVNKLNSRSRSLIEHLGFQQIGETERGVQYAICIASFMSWLAGHR